MLRQLFSTSTFAETEKLKTTITTIVSDSLNYNMCYVMTSILGLSVLYRNKGKPLLVIAIKQPGMQQMLQQYKCVSHIYIANRSPLLTFVKAKAGMQQKLLKYTCESH